MQVNKDTVVCGSFAGEAGNTGATMFNAAFERLQMNWIYKPFSVTNIEAALDSMLTLNIRGAGITMPFKEEAAFVVAEYGRLSGVAKDIQSVNTVTNTNGKLVGYNTDYVAAKKILEPHRGKLLTILGCGGLAAAVNRAARYVGMGMIWHITRDNWHDIASTDTGVVFNCTPVKAKDIPAHPKVYFIDCDVNSETGRELAMLQAAEQFKIYTGLEFPATPEGAKCLR